MLWCHLCFNAPSWYAGQMHCGSSAVTEGQSENTKRKTIAVYSMLRLQCDRAGTSLAHCSARHISADLFSTQPYLLSSTQLYSALHHHPLNINNNININVFINIGFPDFQWSEERHT